MALFSTRALPCTDHSDWELVAPRLLSAAADAVGFVELPVGSDKEMSVRAQFHEGWRHDQWHPEHPAGAPHKPCGEVKRVVRIRNPPELKAAFDARCTVLNARRCEEFTPLRRLRFPLWPRGLCTLQRVLPRLSDHLQRAQKC